jgi:hypothetical protein
VNAIFIATLSLVQPPKLSSSLPLPSYVRTRLVLLSCAGMLCLHVLEVLVPPPARYPDLYPALFSIYGAANLTALFGLLVYWQLSIVDAISEVLSHDDKND